MSVDLSVYLSFMYFDAIYPITMKCWEINEYTPPPKIRDIVCTLKMKNKIMKIVSL